MPRIAFIGGGSLTWIPRFAHDLLREERLSGSTAVLMDTDPTALELMSAYARRLVAERGGNLEIVATTDRQEALEGADFVVSTFMAGGHKAWARDLNIAHSYGIQHPKGMSVGPGGLLQGLKAITQLLDLAHVMERICPQAPLFNYTNPMSSITLALQRHSKVNAIGVCPGITIAMEWFSTLLGIERERLAYRAAGVNHCNWVLQVRDRHTGEELLPAIVDRIKAMPHPANLEQIGEAETLKVSAELYRLFGGMPIPGDFHVTEFFPYFLRPNLDLFQAYGIRHNFVESRMSRRGEYREHIQAALRGTEPLPQPRGESLEKLDQMIAAICFNERRIYHLNTTNDGIIANAMPDMAVEVAVAIDSSGFHPLVFGELPPAIAAWTNLYGAVQDLTVRAAVEGNRQLALQALLLDPMCYHLETTQIESMLAEMLEAQKEWLPQFFPGS